MNDSRFDRKQKNSCVHFSLNIFLKIIISTQWSDDNSTQADPRLGLGCVRTHRHQQEHQGYIKMFCTA